MNHGSLLGIQPILGRQFDSEEENPGRGNVVLIGEALWREHFAADPEILKQSIRLGDRSVTVVGVMPGVVQAAPNAAGASRGAGGPWTKPTPGVLPHP